MNRNGDPVIAKTAADAFFETAKWCSYDADRFLGGQMYPFAVNIAFSCELYLKTIVMRKSSQGEFESGHNLKTLFENLDSDEQDQIISHYQTKCTKDFRELLNESALVFEKWRYAMEGSVSVSVDGMIAFSECLKWFIENNSRNTFY